jgi:tRNA A37 methylthiotransferase MiaB
LGKACVALDKGCPRMTVDVALLYGYLEANGWDLVDDPARADLILAACCAVHEGAEKSGFDSLAHVQARRKEGSRLVVMGCLAGISQEQLSVLHPDADAIPPARTSRLDDLIGATVPLAEIPEVQDRAPYEARSRRSMGLAAEGMKHRLARRMLRSTGLRPAPDVKALTAHVPQAQRVCSLRVAWGCANECTYCAIRLAAGGLRSKPLDKVMAEFDAGLASGFRRFELIAGDVGCWGRDTPDSIVDLLASMFARSGEYKLIVDDFNPRWLLHHLDELVPLLAANTDRIESIMLPVQSGSADVLALMQRGYGRDELVSGLTRLRAAAEDLYIITHVLVGFPGEGDAEFDETRALLATVRFDRIDAYPYADRPNTAAGKLPGKVARDVIEARCDRLMAECPAVIADYK